MKGAEEEDGIGCDAPKAEHNGRTRTREASTWLATFVLAWEALGIIYGDIGTSPLYVYSTIFADFQPTEDDVLGAVSLIFWTLTFIVLIKYVGIVLLADDDGEGGTFSLYSMLCRKIGIRPHSVMFSGESRQLRKLSTRSVPSLEPPVAPAASTSSSGSTNSDRKQQHGENITTRDRALRPQQSGGGGGVVESTALEAISFGASGSQRRSVWWRRLSADGSAVRRWLRRHRAGQLTLWGMTMAATGMVIGDGVLTPAISVMSAVSGLKEATDKVTDTTVVGVSIAILVLLFSAQRLGTQLVAFSFAPIVALWLVSNAGVAIYNLHLYGAKSFAGLSPHYIVRYFAHHGVAAWRSMGSVMLCVTGAEALYADLGHFNRKSIMVGFAFFTYPCLALTYIGQGSFLIHNPEGVADTFWKCIPRPFFYPMLILATLASVVASQALITGCFSIIANAIKLGAFPKLTIQHTSQKIRGQIYLAEINWMLMLLCIAVVAGFQDTVALGKAYGLSVSSVFVLTTLLILVVMLAVWEVSLLAVVPFGVFFLALELSFMMANFSGVAGGAWFSLAVSAGIVYVMTVWWAGSSRRAQMLAQSAPRDLTELFMVVMQPPPPARSSGSSSSVTPYISAAEAAVPAAAPPPAAPVLGSPCDESATAPPALGTPVGTTGDVANPSVMLQDSSIAMGTAVEMTAVVASVSHEQEIRTATNSSGAATPGVRGGGAGGGGAAGATAAKTPSAPSAMAVLGAVSARLSSWRPVQLALRLPGGQMWPLSRQPGIGLYYSETPVGLPHVMLHFLKNIQSMHDVSVFMTVQYMPIPYVVPGERLLVRELRPIPNFYQVVARYGYLDKVDHGPTFITHMVAAIVKALRRRCAADRYLLLRAATTLGEEDEEGTVAIDMDGRGGGRGGGNDGGGDGDGYGSSDGEEGEAGRTPVPQPVGPRGLIGQRTRGADNSAPAVLVNVGLEPSPHRWQQQDRSENGRQLLRPAHRRQLLHQPAPAVDENAVAHVLEAVKHGVVYYLGAVRVRAEPSSPFVTQLLFGSLYRSLLALSHSTVEDWNLPYDQVVELGLVLRIY